MRRIGSLRSHASRIVVVSKMIVHVYRSLANNPWYCSCSMYSTINWLKMAANVEVLDYNNTLCAAPPQLLLQNIFQISANLLCCKYLCDKRMYMCACACACARARARARARACACVRACVLACV